jgi:hypothetical protein
MARRQSISNHVINALHIAVSACISAMLVYVINASLRRLNGYDFFNEWALLHGSFFFIAPFFAFFVWLLYTLLGPVSRWLRSRYSPKGALESRRISVLAILSLITAFPGFLIPLIFSFAAVILGHIARHRCRNQPGLGGSAIALWGLIIGYVGLVFGFYVVGISIYAILIS